MGQFDDSYSQRANLNFIKGAMNRPLLSREEEYELAERWRERGDEKALHQLVGAYTRLVIASAVRFRHYGLPLGDLMQEGSVGLMQAASRFDTGHEVRFSTYATWWIKSAMQDYILRNWSIVRTGTTAAQKSLFFNLRRLRAQIEESPGAGMDDAGRHKVATELGVSLRDVIAMEQRLTAADASLNVAVGMDSDEEAQNFLSDERPNPEDSAITTRDGHKRLVWLAAALAELSPRERSIIHARRLQDDGATLEELGHTLGVSKERVRQLESRALGKLKVSMLRHVEQAQDVILDS
ncbi:RNA polymerase factor sigma-32 [Lacibacterium aquatile]|uniref:RNA polymerase sigma factor n=1 Tax=Lacibacterium aquatile TaxID=1168082 RepID=A0ABW5DRN6_9PROT